MTRSRDVADTQDNLGGAVAPFLAGKNKIINGDFFVNQRAFSSSTTSAAYGFDRWQPINADGTVTYSAQTFTAGTAPVSGYEAKNFARLVTSGQTLSTARASLNQNIEDVRTLAGQTTTVSFWAKAASGTPKVAVEWQQFMGSGGGSSPTNTYGGQVTLSTSWARYSVTFSVPSLSGATVGTVSDSTAVLYLYTSAGSNFNARTGSLGIQNVTIDFWGVQVEAGSVATPFTTASGSIGGELALCQRYYQQIGGDNASQEFCIGQATSATNVDGVIFLPVIMRVAPTVTFTSTASQFAARSATGAEQAGTATSSVRPVPSSFVFRVTVASGLVAGNACTIAANGSTSPRVYISAEL
jgi:hypothetical protein